MYITSLTSYIVIWFIWVGYVKSLTLPRTKEYRGSSEAVSSKNSITEPSCEELKAMWRFSKRQSRAAEITNEIPMYRDPFSDNVWEPYYATSRSMGGMRMDRYRGKPVYGRLVHKPSHLYIQDVAEKNRAFEELAKMYGTVQHQNEPRRRVTAFRLSGGGYLPSMGLPQSGSFQHLKELIRTERARELQEQRLAEENAARAAALRELVQTGNHLSQANYRDLNFNYDINAGENHQNDESYMHGGHEGVLAFPNLLAPSSSISHHPPSDSDDSRFPDYAYSRDRSRNSFFDTNSYNIDDFLGVV